MLKNKFINQSHLQIKEDIIQTMLIETEYKDETQQFLYS